VSGARGARAARARDAPPLTPPPARADLYDQAFSRGGNTLPNSGTLWRWTASGTAPPPPPAAAPTYSSAVAMGHTAGIVLGLLVGGANLAFIYKIFEVNGLSFFGAKASSYPK